MTSHRPENKHLTAKCRSCAALLALTLMGGCSSDNSDNYSQMWNIARTTWSQNDSQVTLAQASAIPYASISYRFGDAREQILVLAAKMGDDELYTSAAHVAIELRHGRIVRTSGFAHDVDSRNLKSADAQGFSSGPRSLSWLADFPEEGLYSTPISCRDAQANPSSIEILGTTIHVLKIDEHCTSKTLDWSFDNVFWIDPVSHFVWRSIQYTNPKQDSFEIEVLRPAG